METTKTIELPQVVSWAILRFRTNEALASSNAVMRYADSYKSVQPGETYTQAKAIALANGWDWAAIEERVRIDNGLDARWMDEAQAKLYAANGGDEWLACVKRRA